MSEFSRPRRRRGPPTVSHLPPNARQEGPHATTIAPPQRGAAIAPETGRVVCVFGPPGAGTSTIIRCLAGATHLRAAVINPDFEDVAEQVRKQAADVVFVDGYPHCGLALDAKTPAGPRAVQYLYDNRLVYPGSGAVIRVAVDPELLVHLRRATRGGVHRWYEGLTAVEARVHELNLPYYLIHNELGEEGLAQAVGDLARRASVQR